MLKSLLVRLWQERRRVSAPRPPGRGATTVPSRVQEVAAAAEGGFLHLLHPDREPEVLGYGELLAAAERWLALYRQSGLAPGQRVVVILPHSVDLYAAYLGALLGGLIPSYFAHPSHKFSQAEYFATLGKLVAVAEAGALVTYPELADRLAGTDLPGEPLVLVATGSLPEGAGNAWTGEADPQATAFVQFSSGTTGLKKGVEISHQALLWQVDAYADAIRLSPTDRIATWLPVYHDMGLIACWLMPLLRGVPIVALSPFDWVSRPASLLQAVSDYQATLCWLPNFAYQFLADRVRDEAIEGISLSSLRGVVNCSEPVRAQSHERFLARFAACGLRKEALAVSYAMAENTFAVTSGGFGSAPAVIEVSAEALARDGLVVPAPEGSGQRLVSSGVPLPETRVLVVDDQGRRLPDGHLGELVISGPSLFKDYLDNPDLTAQRLREDGFHTRDKGFLWNDEVFVIGRTEDMMIIAGKNIHPQDIEAVVAEVPGVLPGRCVAFGIPDESLGTEALTVIAESHLTGEARATLARSIHQSVAARTEVTPADVLVVEHMWLRKSTSGKISRGLNRDRYLASRRDGPAPAGAAPPGDARDLRRVIRDALQAAGQSRITPAMLEGIGDDDPLLAGAVIDSLGFVALVSGLESALGRRLPEQILQHPERYDSISRLAAVLGAQPAPLRQPPAAPMAPVAASRRDQLLPHFRDAEKQPYEWVSYLMRRGAGNYRSASLNTDAYGFRLGWDGQDVFDLDRFRGRSEPCGVVLGNSVAFGVGVSHDRGTLANQLNLRRAATEPLWANLALRASSLTQERLAAELYAPDGLSHLVWVSGINTLISHMLGGGDPRNPSPYVGEWMFRKLTGQSASTTPGDFAGRYPAMVAMMRRDLEIAGAWLRHRGIRGLFLLQPVLAWIDKAQTAEEAELVDLFDRSTLAVQLAHHPSRLGAWREAFTADLAKACADAGLDFVDLNTVPSFAARQWLFADRTHLTDLGHAAIAPVVEAWLRRQ